MLEAENRGVAGRVADLERKVLEQSDELVCLKATLAEALRRLSILEGVRLAQSPSAPSTPVRMNGSVNSMPSKEALRRPVSYSASPRDNGLAIHRRSYGNSALPQRRAVHYQSTGKLALRT